MFERQPIDCVVRFHDPRRIEELNRCVFSLVGQNYRPLNIILVTQRFSDDELAATRQVLEPLMSLPQAPGLIMRNWEKECPADARTEMLNLGLASASGRYVAFLDYDDTLYPEAYEMLIDRLAQTDAAIAFASVEVVQADMLPGFTHITAHITPPFQGKGLLDLFQNNFCPIHSYVIDRHKCAEGILQFDTTLTWEEDYDLLLKICAAHPSDFNLLDKVIGDYYYKSDGSNSVPTDGRLCPVRQNAFAKVQSVLEQRRRTTLLGPEVQQSLGIAPQADAITIRGALDLLEKEAGGLGLGVQRIRKYLKGLALRPLTWVYYLLPRQYGPWLKNTGFRAFPGLFAHTQQYKAWKKIEDRK